ncbi:MAG: hypothetical protein IPP19_10160 [Verrucomicrobia bacterium]|nr:hypothetical protein [Verrucomicrobiota bacterium]
MKWIALTILVFIVGYTFITLYFRKPGAGYQPYKDSKDRATVHRLEQAGYQRVTATISLPADPQRSAARLAQTFAPSQNTFGGLPSELSETLIDKPILPEGFASVAAPSSVAALMPYVFQFTCTLPDKKNTLDETYVYVKESEIAIVASFEKISGELLARSRECTVLVTIPGGTLKPGEYRVTLIGSRNSRQWTLQVK